MPGDLNEKEYQILISRGFKNFLDNEIKNYKQIKRKEDGSCFFLSKDNTCSIYDIRPVDCRLPPFIIEDFNIFTMTIKIGIAKHFCKHTDNFSKGRLSTEIMKEITKSVNICLNDLLSDASDFLQLPINDKRVRIKVRNFVIHARTKI